MKQRTGKQDSRSSPRLWELINPVSPSFFLYQPKVIVPTVILSFTAIALTICSSVADWHRLCNKVDEFRSDVQIGQPREEALKLASSMGLAHKCLAGHCKLDKKDIMDSVDLAYCEETDCNKSKLILVSESPFHALQCTCILEISNETVSRKIVATPHIEFPL
jgi:hypothetical protein